MKDKIKVTIFDEEKEINKGTTLLELSKDYTDKFKYSIILAKVDGIYKELNETILKPVKIEFCDLTERGANRIYLNGLVFLVSYASKMAFGNSTNIVVNHSIDKGLYIEINKNITENEINILDKKMKEIVEDSMDISKLTVSRIDAINYFRKTNDTIKEGITKYNTNTYVTLYKLGHLYDYFYSLMPTNTNELGNFELTYLNDRGFVLRFPTIYMNDGIKKYEHRTNVFNLFKESRDWAKTIKLENVVDLNKLVSNSEIEEIIRIDEIVQSNKLMKIAEAISNNRNNIKVVLMAGPSSSGKTTTCNKLSMYLKSFGLRTIPISMDDYFVERTETPIDDDGKPDFERLEAIDLSLFNETIAKILNFEEVKVPTYNFVHGTKEYKKSIKIDDGDILLIEGIHALNPKILENIPRSNKTLIYLSALTELNIDSHSRVSTTDNRLLRRIVRDNRTRGYKVEMTLDAWTKVREGEEKYIFPYQDVADYTYNTALIYELGVLKTYVEPLLYSVEIDSPYYNEAKRLINFLRVFLPIPSEVIPDDSILREFIGGSCFK